MIACLCHGVSDTAIRALIARGARTVSEIIMLNDGIELCRGLGDNGSRDLLEDILRGEEQHIDWIESQITLIQQMGEAHYLAQQVHHGE